MAEFSYQVKITKERIAVLIGKSGEVKKQIEEATNTKISIDSHEGDVTVSGQDAVSLYASREIINAIGRGFNPEVALLLLKQDYGFELIDITDYAKTKNHMVRIKGRIIGAQGKSRKTIEHLTECFISVYGKTVGIIGSPEGLTFARKAIESLLSGSPHANVYRWLEKMRRNLHSFEMEDIKK
ncbi:RNA-processing protein [Candidatus Woesearchaeota archaeon]|nr:RNA-processing protein [Candidatus Woesearchaeota archaeon]